MRKNRLLWVALLAIFWIVSAGNAYALSNLPTTSPTVFSATPLQQTVSLAFTAGNGNKTLIVYSTSNNATSVSPTNGVTYAPGCLLSAGLTVGYAGVNASPIVITGLSAGTTYYFALYSYNDVNGTLVNNSSIGSEAYKTTTPLTGSATTSTYTTTAMKTGVVGTWETAANWLINNSGWVVSSSVPTSTTPTTLAASYEPIVTTVSSPWINPSGIYLESGAKLGMKPGGGTTYATTGIEVLKNITVDGGGNAITLKPYTRYNGTGVVNYRPGITNVLNVTYELNINGTYSSSNWNTCFNPTTIPYNCQLYVTSAVGTTAGSAGFAISNDAILSSTKVNLGDGVRLLRQYNANASAPYTTTVIGELSGSTNSTIEGNFAAGRTLYYYIGGLNTDATFNGKIKNYVTGDLLNIYKKGTKAWTLTADSHLGFLTGLFNVDAGNVILTSTGRLGGTSVPVTVASGASLQGAFGSTIDGMTTVNGTLTGSMAFSTNLTLAGTTNLSVNGYTTAGTDYDYINATGTVTNGGTLNITINALPTGNTSIQLIKAGTYIGSFSTINIKDGSGTTPVGFSYSQSTGYLTYSLAAPTIQTTSLNIPSVLQTSANLSWTLGDGTNNLVLYSTNSDVAIAYPPQDNTTYTVGSTTGAGYIVGAISHANTATLTGLNPGTTYYFAVFGYNDYNTTGMERYLRTAPANANASTPPNSSATDQFKTLAAGRWDAVGTWLSSTNGASWHVATMIPQSTSTSTLITTAATVLNPIVIGEDILPASFNMEDGAKLKLSKVYNSTSWTFANNITGTGAITLQLDTVPAKPYLYTINPIYSGFSTVNYILNPIGDAVGIRIVGGDNKYNVGFGGATKAPLNTQFNVTTTKTAGQGFPLADDLYLQDSKLNLGDYVNLVRLNSNGAATSTYIGELASNASTLHAPTIIGGFSGATNRTESFYIGGLNTDAIYGGQFALYGSNATYSPIDIHKVGTGTWTLSGAANANHYGNFFVDNGKVVLNGSIGTSLITTIGSGAILDGTYTGAGTATLNGTAIVNGTLQGSVYVTGATTLGSTGVLSGTHTFGSTLSLAGTTNLIVTDFTSNYNVITVTGAITYGGTLNITIPASAPATGTSIRLINFGSYTGSFSTINCPVGYVFDPTTGVLTKISMTSTFTGSGNWSDPKWDNAPVSGSDIIVPTGSALTIDQPATLKSLTVAPGAAVTLNSGTAMTATTLTLQSDVTHGTGTFVDADATGKTITGTVQQYLPQGRNWYVGVPVNDALNTLSAALTAGGASSVSYWDEPTGAWVDNYTGNLSNSKGYIAISSDGTATNTISFSGILNTGNIPVTVTRTVGAAKEGFNLISNPYPSYLNPCAVITASSTLEPTIWYRTKGDTYSFETVNTASGEGTNGVTGYIPPMQGFWVREKPNAADATQNNSETITLTNAMRSHANPTGVTTTLLKAKSMLAQTQRIRMQVSNGVSEDETLLYTNENASNNYDVYDSHKMSNDNVAIPEIYTVAGTENLVINGFNQFPVDQEIALGFQTGQSNTFALKATQIQNLDAGTTLVLKDNLMNATVALTEGVDYTFTSDVTNTTSRFSLVLMSTGSVTGNVSLQDGTPAFMAYCNANNQLVISGVRAGNNVSVFNMMGQKLVEQKVTSEPMTLLHSFIPGVYVVMANSILKKVIVK